MLDRRRFLMAGAMIAQAPAILAQGLEGHRQVTDYPEGVIAPYDWGEQPIPVSGTGAAEMQSVDDHMTAAMRKYGIVGCGVCIVQKDKIVYEKGFGYAELPKTPFLTTTATRCGSLAKAVTALCALLLFDQGKLDLDAPILPLLKEGGILPKPVGDVQMDSRVAQIRVRHLMDHTSGLPTIATYTAWRQNRDVAAVHGLKHPATGADVASDALGNTTLASEPGAKYQYANANFVLLARIVEAVSKKPFHEFLAHVAMARFGLKPDAIYVSRNQERPNSSARGKNEASYYQTSSERYVSFLPADHSKGRVMGEAYLGYATEASDGAGGIACTATGLGTLLANLHSATPVLSAEAMRQILTPPEHYTHEPNFHPTRSSFYSKGLNVRFSGGQPWFSHSGMTNHCGGMIGYHAGYQFVGVSNWNYAQSPYVDAMLNRALTDAVAHLGQ